jgi:hypothetical protein
MLLATPTLRRSRLDSNPVELSIVASGSARLTMRELAAIRAQSLPNLPARFSSQLVRNSDAATFAALVALSNATKSIAMASKDFRNWAIVSSSQSSGGGGGALSDLSGNFQGDWPWRVSAEAAAHRTAHAVADTIRTAIGSHGPCIGARDGELSALFSAASVLRQPGWCGAWVVFTTGLPELTSGTALRRNSDSVCLAAALAVTRHPSSCALGRIRIASPPPVDWQSWDESGDDMPLLSATEFLSDEQSGRRTWSSPATASLRVDIELARGVRREPGQRVPVADAVSVNQSRFGCDARGAMVVS